MANIPLKHKSNFVTPMIDKIADPEVRQALNDLFRQLGIDFTNVYDDLRNVQKAAYVSALPTAAAEYRGRIFLLENVGAEDTAHICVYDAGGATYAWKTITLT